MVNEDKVTTRNIVDTISSRTGISKIDTSRVLEQFFFIVVSELSKNKSVSLHGFGKFYNTVHAPKVVNRVNDAPVEIGYHVVTNFKISRTHKAVINKHYKENKFYDVGVD